MTTKVQHITLNRLFLLLTKENETSDLTVQKAGTNDLQPDWILSYVQNIQQFCCVRLLLPHFDLFLSLRVRFFFKSTKSNCFFLVFFSLKRWCLLRILAPLTESMKLDGSEYNVSESNRTCQSVAGHLRSNSNLSWLSQPNTSRKCLFCFCFFSWRYHFGFEPVGIFLENTKVLEKQHEKSSPEVFLKTHRHNLYLYTQHCSCPEKQPCKHVSLICTWTVISSKLFLRPYFSSTVFIWLLAVNIKRNKTYLCTLLSYWY